MPALTIDPRWAQAHNELIAGMSFVSRFVSTDYNTHEEALRQQLDNELNTMPERLERIQQYQGYVAQLWSTNNNQVPRTNGFRYWDKLVALGKLKARGTLANSGFKAYFKKKIQEWLILEIKDLLIASGRTSGDMRLTLCNSSPSTGFSPTIIEQLRLYIEQVENNEAIQSVGLVGCVNNQYILIGFYGCSYVQFLVLQVHDISGNGSFVIQGRPYRNIPLERVVGVDWNLDSTSWPFVLPLQDIDLVRWFSATSYRQQLANLDSSGFKYHNPSYPRSENGVFFGVGGATGTTRTGNLAPAQIWYTAEEAGLVPTRRPQTEPVLSTHNLTATEIVNRGLAVPDEAVASNQDDWAQYIRNPNTRHPQQEELEQRVEINRAITASIHEAAVRARTLRRGGFAYPQIPTPDDEEALF